MVKRERQLPPTAEPLLPKAVTMAALLLLNWLAENESRNEQKPSQADQQENAQKAETQGKDASSNP